MLLNYKATNVKVIIFNVQAFPLLSNRLLDKGFLERQIPECFAEVSKSYKLTKQWNNL